MKEVMQIFSTKDYNNFKFMKGNRPVNRLHVERLKESFAVKYLLSPIVVNEEGFIIDGQHRYVAAMELDLEVYFIVIQGFGLKEVQIYNMNATNWNKTDFLNMYCDLGYEEYLKLRQFMSEYNEFSLRTCINLVTDKTSLDKSHKEGKSFYSRNFEEGTFVVTDLMEGMKSANKLRQVKPYYNGFTRLSFVNAMINVFRKKEYVHDTFLQRLESNPNSLYHCSSVGEYKNLIEQIYNYRNRKPINLRF